MLFMMRIIKWNVTSNFFLLLILFVLIPYSFLYAINGTIYTSKKGELVGSKINHIMQDSEGYIWISTEDGLSKFDGYSFTQYQNIINDSTSLRVGYYKIIFEDSRNRLWINGTQIYDRENDNFINVTFKDEKGLVINPQVYTVLERKNGELWFGTSQGLYCGTVSDLHPVLKQSTHLVSLKNKIRILALSEDSDGNVWIGTDEYGLLQYTSQGKISYAMADDGYPINNVSAICYTPAGILFVSSFTDGVFMKERNKKNFKRIMYDSNVNSLFYDEVNELLLIGTDGEGLKSWSLSKQQNSDLNIEGVPVSIGDLKIHAITKDRSGNLWLGAYQKGVIFIPCNKLNFGYIGSRAFDYRNIIGDCFILSLYSDRNNVLWIGTDNDGLYKLEPLSRKLFHWSRGSFPKTIMDIIQDYAGRTWIATYHDGLIFIDNNCQKYETYDFINPTVKRISCLDINDKQLWVGTFGSGVIAINLETGKEITYDNKNSVLTENWINVVYTDREGHVWIGCSDGLYMVEEDKLVNITTKWGWRNIYSVNSIKQDQEGGYWIATRDGLYYNRNGQMKHFTIDNGLPSNFINQIEEDEIGNIWVSTKVGIAYYDIRYQRFICFDEDDGLQGDEFSKASCIDSYGRFYFGGINGISFFSPLEIRRQVNEQQDKPILTVSGLKTANLQRIPIKDNIKLDYPENTINIALTTFNFASPKNVSYQYSINGKWNNFPQGSNQLTLTGLPHGKYRLGFRAWDNSSCSDVIYYTLFVTPPWYLLFWVKIFWVMLALIIVLIIVCRVRVAQKQKQNAERIKNNSEINNKKLQFFINLSHEIRNPIALIITPLEQLLLEKSDKQCIYQMMYRNVQRVLQLTNQIMDLRKIDMKMMKMRFKEINLKNYVEAIVRNFDFQAKSMDIDLQFKCKEDEIKVYVDFRHFDKIIINLLSNAFKFTPQKGTITVEMQKVQDTEKQCVKIIVEDTGIGISEENINCIFERFYQVDNKINEINFGTGIGLHLVKSLVEMHYGSICVESNFHKQGSRFIIEIPLGNGHLNPEELDTSLNDADEILLSNETVIDGSCDDLFASEQIIISESDKNRSTILLVDDDFEMRSYLRHELENEFDICEQNSGENALAYILKEKPELVISDVCMNTMDGITLCKKVKNNLNIASIPIILFTAQPDERFKIKGLEYGADAYLEKPFKIDILKSVIHNLLNKKKRENRIKEIQKKQDEQLQPVSLECYDDKIFNNIMEVINRNLDNPKLNVNMLANEIGMNRVQLYRFLKEKSGQTPIDFIRNIRLKRAATLLETTEGAVSEIAYQVGYNSISHFSSSFKSFYGLMPTEYRRRNKN